MREIGMLSETVVENFCLKKLYQIHIGKRTFFEDEPWEGR